MARLAKCPGPQFQAEMYEMNQCVLILPFKLVEIVVDCVGPGLIDHGGRTSCHLGTAVRKSSWAPAASEGRHYWTLLLSCVQNFCLLKVH